MEDCNARITVGQLVHRKLGRAFSHSLGLRGNIEDARRRIMDPGGNDEGVRTRCKRLLKSSEFLMEPRTQPRMLRQAIITVPLDKLLHTMFRAQENARLNVARRKRGEALVTMGLLQSMASDGGVCATVLQMVAQLLLDPAHDLRRVCDIMHSFDDSRREAARENRAMSVRTSCEFFVRFAEVYTRDPFVITRLLTLPQGSPEALGFINSYVDGCDWCKSLFGRRVKEKLRNGWTRDTLDSAMFRNAIYTVAEEGLVLLSACVEELHAGLRHELQASMKKKRSIIRSITSQLLSRTGVWFQECTLQKNGGRRQSGRGDVRRAVQTALDQMAKPGGRGGLRAKTAYVNGKCADYKRDVGVVSRDQQIALCR